MAICNLQFAIPSRRRNAAANAAKKEQRAVHDSAPDGPTPTSNALSLLQDGLAIMWIVIVAAQYALVLQLPGAPDASASYLPLLAGLLVTGIMSYLRRRRDAS